MLNRVAPDIPNIFIEERELNQLSHEYDIWDYQELKYLSEEQDLIKIFLDALQSQEFFTNGIYAVVLPPIRFEVDEANG